MMDLLCVALIVGFFVLALALARGCEALEKEED